MWAAVCVFLLCSCICLHKNPHTSACVCVCVCSWTTQGLGRVRMKYGSNLALCPKGPALLLLLLLPLPPPCCRPTPPDAFPRPFGQTSWAERWGVRFILAGCETGSITSQEPCWVTTLLWRRGRAGGLGTWGACARPSASVKCSVALSVWKGCSGTDWRGHSCTWLVYAHSGCPLWTAWTGWVGVFGVCGCLCPDLNSTRWV